MEILTEVLAIFGIEGTAGIVGAIIALVSALLGTASVVAKLGRARPLVMEAVGLVQDYHKAKTGDNKLDDIEAAKLGRRLDRIITNLWKIIKGPTPFK